MYLFSILGPKKQTKMTLKNLVKLYSLFSSEVASVLLDLLLKALNSLDNLKNSDIISTIDDVLGDWKLVVAKVSNKEPDLLLTLLKEILDRIDTQVSTTYPPGIFEFSSSFISPGSISTNE